MIEQKKVLLALVGFLLLEADKVLEVMEHHLDPEEIDLAWEMVQK